LAILELKKEVFDWGWGIPLGCHGSVVGSEILGADCPVFMPEVLEDLEGSARTTHFGDRVFECCEIFVRAAVGDHGDENDLEFAESFAVFTCNALLAYIFYDLKCGETLRVWWSWSWVGWWSKGGLIFREPDVAVVGMTRPRKRRVGSLDVIAMA
jgi:hypothetical protein